MITPLPCATSPQPRLRHTPFFGVVAQVVDGEGRWLVERPRGISSSQTHGPGQNAHRVRRMIASWQPISRPSRAVFHGDGCRRNADAITGLPASRRTYQRLGATAWPAAESNRLSSLHEAVAEPPCSATPTNIKGPRALRLMSRGLRCRRRADHSLRKALFQHVRKGIPHRRPARPHPVRARLPKRAHGKSAPHPGARSPMTRWRFWGDTSTLADPGWWMTSCEQLNSGGEGDGAPMGTPRITPSWPCGLPGHPRLLSLKLGRGLGPTFSDQHARWHTPCGCCGESRRRSTGIANA